MNPSNKNALNLEERASTPNNSRQFFNALLEKIQQTNWKISLNESVKKYSLEAYKVTQLTPKNVQKLYSKISSKYKISQNERIAWFQNELRIYIWFLAVTTNIFKLSPVHYKQQQLMELSKPFFGLSVDLCQYQYRTIICAQPFRTWETDQNLLLSSIIKKHSSQGSWSIIAKQLFFESKKKFFRTAQNCRERWQNHLDERKIKGQWTLKEDYLLIKHVISEGKKWSTIAKKIGDTRTQHMVKNRFQTILRRQLKVTKKPLKFSQQFQFCQQFIKKLSEDIQQKPLLEQLSNIHGESSEQEDQLKQEHNERHMRLDFQNQTPQNIKRREDTSKQQGSNLKQQLQKQKDMNFSFQLKEQKGGFGMYSSQKVDGLCQDWLSKLDSKKDSTQMDLQVPVLVQEEASINRNESDFMSNFLMQSRQYY